MENSIITTNSIGFFEKLRLWGLSQTISSFIAGNSCCKISIDQHITELDSIHLSNDLDLHNDLLIINGVITHRLKPYLLDVYNQMPEKSWVIAIGGCSIEGGPINSYSALSIQKILPVDVYIPGCPPTESALVHGIHLLKEKIKLGEYSRGKLLT